MPNCQCIPKECPPTIFYCILFGKWSIPGGLTSHLDTTMIPRFTACTRIIVSYRVDHGEHVCKLQLQQKNIHGLIRYQNVTDLKGPVVCLESHVGRATTSSKAGECGGAHVQVQVHTTLACLVACYHSSGLEPICLSEQFYSFSFLLSCVIV